MPTVLVVDDDRTVLKLIEKALADSNIKPLDFEQVQDVVERALETRRLMQEPVTIKQTEEDAASDDGDAFVGRSPQILDVYKEIGRVAAQDVTVLIYGESGTGKELVARAIYQHSRRNDRLITRLYLNLWFLTGDLQDGGNQDSHPSHSRGRRCNR